MYQDLQERSSIFVPGLLNMHDYRRSEGQKQNM